MFNLRSYRGKAADHSGALCDMCEEERKSHRSTLGRWSQMDSADDAELDRWGQEVRSNSAPVLEFTKYLIAR